MCGVIPQLVEYRTGIAEVTGSNPVEALIFFRLLLSNCLNWKIYCDDRSLLSSTSAVQIWIISYKLNIISLHGKIWTQWIHLAPNVWLHSSSQSEDEVSHETTRRKCMRLIGNKPLIYIEISEITRSKLGVSEEKRTKANMIPVIRIYALYLETVLSRPTGTGVTT